MPAPKCGWHRGAGIDRPRRGASTLFRSTILVYPDGGRPRGTRPRSTQQAPLASCVVQRFADHRGRGPGRGREDSGGSRRGRRDRADGGRVRAAAFLMRNPKRVMSKAQILDRVRSFGRPGEHRRALHPAEEDRHRTGTDDPHPPEGAGTLGQYPCGLDQRHRPHPRRRPAAVAFFADAMNDPHWPSVKEILRQAELAVGHPPPKRVTNPWAARSAPTSRSPGSNRTFTLAR